MSSWLKPDSLVTVVLKLFWPAASSCLAPSKPESHAFCAELSRAEHAASDRRKPSPDTGLRGQSGKGACEDSSGKCSGCCFQECKTVNLGRPSKITPTKASSKGRSGRRDAFEERRARATRRHRPRLESSGRFCVCNSFANCCKTPLCHCAPKKVYPFRVYVLDDLSTRWYGAPSQEYATLSDQYAAEISRLDEQCKAGKCRIQTTAPTCLDPTTTSQVSEQLFAFNELRMAGSSQRSEGRERVPRGAAWHRGNWGIGILGVLRACKHHVPWEGDHTLPGEPQTEKSFRPAREADTDKAQGAAVVFCFMSNLLFACSQ